MLDKRGLWATALVALLALSCDDGSSTPAKDSTAADGGGKSSGTKASGDKGSSGKDGGANVDGGGGGNNADAGQDAGVDQGPNNTGDLGSIWKRYSSDITIIDPADPADRRAEDHQAAADRRHADRRSRGRRCISRSRTTSC